MRKKLISLFILPAFLAASLMAPAAQAGIVTTDQYVHKADIDAQRADINALLAREDVREKLVSAGVSPDAVKLRVASMSDDEIVAMHERMQDMPAGAGIVEAAVFVFLVLLVTDILGITDVFPFVKAQR